LTEKIGLEMFGKNTDFRNSQKKFGKNRWREISFFSHFLNSWVLRKRGKGRYSQKYEKKWKSLHPTVQVTNKLLRPLHTVFLTWYSSIQRTFWSGKWPFLAHLVEDVSASDMMPGSSSKRQELGWWEGAMNTPPRPGHVLSISVLNLFMSGLNI
jgi:hypothetical protein